MSCFLLCLSSYVAHGMRMTCLIHFLCLEEPFGRSNLNRFRRLKDFLSPILGSGYIASVGIVAHRHRNHHCLREMIAVAVAITLAPTFPSPFSTTLHRHPIDGTRPHPQRSASVGVGVGAGAVCCCFSGTIHRLGIDFATMTFSTIAVDDGIKTTTMTGLSPSVMMSSSLHFRNG